MRWPSRAGWAAGVAVSLAGCLWLRPARDPAEGRYDLLPPGPGWKVVEPGGADVAWRHGPTGATFYADSNCGTRFEDVPLERQLQRLAAGLDGWHEVEREELRLDGRRAVSSRGLGSLDGVDVETFFTVVVRGDCLYDFVLIAPPGLLEGVIPDVRHALQGFRVRR